MPFEIRVEHAFAATHQLRLPDGALEPLHGHGWQVRVSVRAAILDAMDCVMDFHELQRQLAAITEPWDRKRLNDVPPFSGGVNPSAERVAEAIARGLRLPAGVELLAVDVGEATGCSAIYSPAMTDESSS